jgi:hypothetical protein
MRHCRRSSIYLHEEVGAEVISVDLDKHGEWNVVTFADWDGYKNTLKEQGRLSIGSTTPTPRTEPYMRFFPNAQR